MPYRAAISPAHRGLVARNREPGALDPDSRRLRPRDAGRGSPLCERKPGPQGTHGGQSLGSSGTAKWFPQGGRTATRVPGRRASSGGLAQSRATARARGGRPDHRSGPHPPSHSGTGSALHPRARSDTEAGCPGRVPSPDTRPVWKPGADRPPPGPTGRQSGRRPDSRLPAAAQCSRGAGTTWSAPPGAPGPPV